MATATDGDKMAAAILAVEAAKQILAMNPEIAQQPRFNITGHFLGHYQSILAQLRAQSIP